MGIVSSLFTNNNKKWRDFGKQLEVSATLFFWGLALEISFLPTMIHHHLDGNTATKNWEVVMNKVIISFLVAVALNFGEKILMQLIAMQFHLRTYADRIELNKFQITSLTKLYNYSRDTTGLADKEFEGPSGAASGTRTPAQLVKDVQRNTAEAFKRLGDVTGKIAGDFAGREINSSTHPHQVILTLLASTEGSQALARRMYRTYCTEGLETVHQDELRPAFDNDEEADAAFTMFDKDMNGDISMEELEAVCVEIGRERKSITASLKDLDSVVGKLDSVLVFIVCLIALLVLISLLSTSAAGVLTSAGSTVLALSWLFSATAQEFLQSIIFVFVKHPFDVGDRVSIYGNTGSAMKGDDYFVKKISLLYTEFKKMEGHIVQAPNSYLNQLFILNQRRSSGLAEAIPITIKFGTTLEQIDTLRQQLLGFVTAEKREYQSNILTELRDVVEAHAIVLNVVFFYKSNWQNELLRLQRRNKFICALMVGLQECGIEGPRMRYPGQKESFPVYLSYVAPPSNSNPDTSGGNENGHADPPFVEPVDELNQPIYRRPSQFSSTTRRRGESLAQMGRRVDFSLGMKDVTSSDLTGDVYSDRERIKLPNFTSPVVSDTSSQVGSQAGERRASSEIGRSSSVARNSLARVGTDSSISMQRSNHRNRFLGRLRGQGEDDSLEAMEAGIPSIPENMRLDPRSGLVSPVVYRTSSEEPRPGQGPAITLRR
jgi:small-conductance mechanosensitive channel